MTPRHAYQMFPEEDKSVPSRIAASLDALCPTCCGKGRVTITPRLPAIRESQVHSAYIDSDGSTYLYDKEERELAGWPAEWPREVADIAHFLRHKEINIRS